MLKLASELIGRTTRTADREIGVVRDIVFDSKNGNVRFLGIDTGTGKTFVDSRSVQNPLSDPRGMTIGLTEEQILNADIQPDPESVSFAELREMSIVGEDGVAGKLSDLIVDPRGWTVPYFVADIQRDSTKKKVILPAHWIEEYALAEGRIYVDLSREEAFYGLRFEPEAGLSEDTEEHLIRNYGVRTVVEEPESPAVAA